MNDCGCSGGHCRLHTPAELQEFAAAIKAIYKTLRTPPKCDMCKKSAITSVWIEQLPKPRKYRELVKGRDIIHFCSGCWKEARSGKPNPSDTEAIF